MKTFITGSQNSNVVKITHWSLSVSVFKIKKIKTVMDYWNFLRFHLDKLWPYDGHSSNGGPLAKTGLLLALAKV